MLQVRITKTGRELQFTAAELAALILGQYTVGTTPPTPTTYSCLDCQDQSCLHDEACLQRPFL